MANKGAIRESLNDRVFMFLIYALLTVFFLVVLYPLVYIFSSSFSSPQAVLSGRVWLWPVEPTLMGYQAVFKNPQIGIGFANSVFYAFFGTFINVTLTVMLGYALSVKGFYGRQAIMGMLVFTLLFSGGLIPTYLVVKDLGILNTRWAMLLPGALAVWQVIITRTFFQATIPNELREAAEIDGCRDVGFMARVAFPLAKPIIAVLFLMYAVGNWNAYFDALIYLKSPNLFPLQIILRNILVINSVDPTMMINVNEMAAREGLKNLLKYSLIVVSSGPVLILYPFIQKYFVKGMMIGSLKG